MNTKSNAFLHCRTSLTSAAIESLISKTSIFIYAKFNCIIIKYMDRDEKYKKIREHMDVKLRERKNKISVTASDQERMSLHPNYL